MFRAIPRAKKKLIMIFFLELLNNNNSDSFSLSILYSHSNSHSYGMAISIIIAVARQNYFQSYSCWQYWRQSYTWRLDWIKNCKLGVGGSLIVANDVSLPQECFPKKSEFLKKQDWQSQLWCDSICSLFCWCAELLFPFCYAAKLLDY